MAGRGAGLRLAAAWRAALLGLVAMATRLMRQQRPGHHGTNLPKWTLALLPLGLGMWAAHLCFHLLTAWDSLVPALLQAAHEVARHGGPLARLPRPDWMGERPLLGPGSLLDLQFGLLDAGLLGGLYLGWRVLGEPGEPGESATGTRAGVLPRARQMLPWALLACSLYAAGIWILLQPMQMRGMVGM